MELLGRFELPTSSLPTDWKPGNRWYSAVSGSFCSGKMMFSVLSAPLAPFVSFAVWVRLWVSAQFAVCLTGLTRRNFNARSGVVSGQSLSKVIGMDLARSNSSNSSWVKASSFINSFALSAAFAIINTSFKASRQSDRDQLGNLFGLAILMSGRSFRIYHKKNITRPMCTP